MGVALGRLSGAEREQVASERPAVQRRVEPTREVGPVQMRSAEHLRGKAPELLSMGERLQLALSDSTALQRSMGGGEAGGNVHAIAAEGVKGSGGTLPYYEQIQKSFGRHDVSHVQAHVGGGAKSASQAIGAEAYAMGDQVAFQSSPSLHTAAHEAAHVVQQAHGVSLKGGVGEVGDVYERHADEVADAVVAGQSAEGILDRMAGGGGGGAMHRAPVQRSARHDNQLVVTTDADGGAHGSYVKPWRPDKPFEWPPKGAVKLVLDVFAMAGVSGGSSGFSGFFQVGGDVGLAAGLPGPDWLSPKAFVKARPTLKGALVFGGDRIFDFRADAIVDLLGGVTALGATYQHKFGTFKLMNVSVQGLIELALDGESDKLFLGSEYEGHFDPDAVQKRKASIQRQDNGAVPSIRGVELTSVDVSAGEDVQTLVDYISSLWEEVVACYEALGETAYDGFAALGGVFGVEDPRQVRERVNAAIDALNAKHTNSEQVRLRWIGAGADEFSAGNLERCWLNAQHFSFKPPPTDWTKRLGEEESATMRRINTARQAKGEIEGELLDLGVDAGWVTNIGGMVLDAHLQPSYVIQQITANTGEELPDEDRSGKVAELHAMWQSAYEEAKASVESDE